MPFHIIKQLLQDIESESGISGLERSGKKTLAALLDKKNKERDNLGYGQRGSELRKKVSKKVSKWKQLELQGQYSEKILNFYGVTSFANRKKKTPASLEKEIVNLSIEEDELSDFEKPDDEPLPLTKMDTKNKRTTVDAQPAPPRKTTGPSKSFFEF
jgi:hypothetical protein